MQENRFQKGKLATDLDALSLSEIPGLLEVLAGRAGLGGLSKADEALLEGILGWWSLKDQDAAVGWVLALRSKEDRNNLFGEMLETISSENPDDALVLLEDLSQRHGETPHIPVNLLKKSAERGADTLLRVCKAGRDETDSTGGYELEYPADFDFMAALHQLGELQASAAEGERLSYVPTNLAKEWAKRDPQAALDWLMSGKDVMFNSDVSEVIAGYREVADDANVGGLIADLYIAKGGYADVWSTLTEIGSESVVREFLAQAPGDGGQGKHIAGLLQASVFGNTSDDAATRAVLLNTMDAQGRRDLFAGNKPIKIRSETIRTQMRAELQRLGHPPEEVRQMLGE